MDEPYSVLYMLIRIPFHPLYIIQYSSAHGVYIRLRVQYPENMKHIKQSCMHVRNPLQGESISCIVISSGTSYRIANPFVNFTSGCSQNRPVRNLTGSHMPWHVILWMNLLNHWAIPDTWINNKINYRKKIYSYDSLMTVFADVHKLYLISHNVSNV